MSRANDFLWGLAAGWMFIGSTLLVVWLVGTAVKWFRAERQGDDADGEF